MKRVLLWVLAAVLLIGGATTAAVVSNNRVARDTEAIRIEQASGAEAAGGERSVEAPDIALDDSDICLITIDNGAAEANTSYAVNGLHVYDPTSEDLDDFVSGVEAPVGTSVSIFVYNLASPVHLTIVHDGRMIADKDYPILTSDDDVEFFDFVLEGDLTVTTTVAEPETEEGQAVVHINDESLASVYLGSTQLHEGSVIEAGIHEFKVVTKDKDVTAVVKAGGKTIVEGKLDKSSSYDFVDIDVQDAVYFEFQTVSASETGDNDAGVYTVTVSNRTGRGDITLNVRWLEWIDNTPNVRNVTSGSAYPRGLDIYTQVINASDQSVRISAYMNGSLVSSRTLAAKPANDDATYGGLDEIALTGNLTIVLELVGSGQTPAPTPAPTNRPAPTPAPGGGEEKLCTITINDGAKTANTDNEVNALHVYTGTQDDYSSGAKVKVGTPVTIYVYNYATPVHLTIIHNGKTIVDKDYGMITPWEDDDKIEFIDITLEGDLVVTTSVAKTDEKPSTHIVTYSDKVQDENVTLNVMWMDENSDYGAVESGKAYAEGLRIFAQVINSSDEDIKVTACSGSTVLETATVTPDDMFGGVGPLALDRDIAIVMEPPESEVPTTYTVTINNQADISGVTLNVRTVEYINDVPTPVDIVSGQAYPADTLIYVQVLNETDQALKVSAIADGKVIDSAEIKAKPEDDDMSAGGLFGLTLTANMNITLEAVENEKPSTHTVTYEDRVQDENVTLNVMWMDENNDYGAVESGKTYAEGLNIFAQVINSSAADVKVTIKAGDTVLESETVTPDDMFGGAGPIALDRDIAIVMEPIEQENEKVCTITINDGAQVANTDTEVNALHVYTGSEDDYVSGAKVKVGTPVTVYVYNYATPVHLTIIHNGKTIVDKDYGMITPWEDDDKIEFIDISLEGDLVITTSVAAASGKSALHIRGDAPGEVYDGDSYDQYSDGDTLKNGTYNFFVYGNPDKDVTVTVTIGGHTVAEADIAAGYNDHEFSDIEVTGDITFLFIAKTEEDTPKAYTVTIDDKVNDKDVTLNVMWMDENNDYGAVDSGKAYAEGLNIFAQVINSSVADVRVTIKAGDTVLESETVTPDDMFGGAGPVALDRDIAIVMERAEQENEDLCTITINDGAKAANTDTEVNAIHVYDGDTYGDDYVSGAKVPKGTKVELYVYNLASPVRLTVVHNGETVVDKTYDIYEPYVTDTDFIDFVLEGDVVITTAVAEVEEEPASYTVTIDNKVDVNGVTLNVRTVEYIDDVPTPVDIVSGGAYPADTLIYVQVLNETDQALKVSATADGKVIDSAEIEAKPADDDMSAGGLFGLTLTADMSITLEAVAGTAPSIPADEEDGEVTLHITGSPVGWVYIGYSDYSDGDKLEKDTYTFTVYGNEDEDVTVTVTMGGQVIGSADIAAGYNTVDFENIRVDADITFTFAGKPNTALTSDGQAEAAAYAAAESGSEPETEGDSSPDGMLETDPEPEPEAAIAEPPQKAALPKEPQEEPIPSEDDGE